MNQFRYNFGNFLIYQEYKLYTVAFPKLEPYENKYVTARDT